MSEEIKAVAAKLLNAAAQLDNMIFQGTFPVAERGKHLRSEERVLELQSAAVVKRLRKQQLRLIRGQS